MKAGLQAISGDGSRLALGAAGQFAGTRDGFFHAGHLARLAGTTLEVRYGHADGFGWNSAANLAFNRPVGELSGAPGLRLNLSRAARNGVSTYASGSGELGRCGGLQHVTGRLCNVGLTPQLYRLGLPVSYEEETTSAIRGQMLAPVTQPSVPDERSLATALVGSQGSSPCGALTQTLRSSDALQRSDVLRLQQTHVLRQAKTWRYGINFDRFTPLWLPRLRLQALRRDVRLIEMTKLGAASHSIRLERTLRREYRAMLSVPFGRLINFCSSFLASLLPQLWFISASERRVEGNLVAHGPLHSNERWQQTAAAWRDDKLYPAPTEGSLDDALDVEVNRLRGRGRSRTGGKLDLKGIVAEERHEKRSKLCVPLNYLPTRGAHATQFHEITYGHGRRATLASPQPCLPGAALSVAKSAPHKPRTYQSFRDVTYERNQQTRLSNQTEVRAVWETRGEDRLTQLALQSTWTFNARNEAVTGLSADAMRAAFGAINDAFGAALLAPDGTPVRGECRVRSVYALSRSQVHELCAALLATSDADAVAGAELLAPTCLHKLRTELRRAKNDGERFEAIAEFVTRARRVDAAYATDGLGSCAPASVLAMACLHRLVRAAPQVTTKVEHFRRVAAMEQAHAVVSRYDDGPLDGQTNAYELRERLAAGLAAVRELEQLQAPGAPRMYFDEAGGQNQQLELARLSRGLNRVLDVGEVGGHRHQQVMARLTQCPLSPRDLELLTRCLEKNTQAAAPVQGMLQVTAADDASRLQLSKAS